MTFLVVDNQEKRLRQLVALLAKMYPEERIEATCDPLLAGKFIYNNHVDCLFAALAMRPTDGKKLGAVVRRKTPGIKVILLDYETELSECAENKSDNFRILLFPISEDAIRQSVAQAAI